MEKRLVWKTWRRRQNVNENTTLMSLLKSDLKAIATKFHKREVA